MLNRIIYAELQCFKPFIRSKTIAILNFGQTNELFFKIELTTNYSLVNHKYKHLTVCKQITDVRL